MKVAARMSQQRRDVAQTVGILQPKSGAAEGESPVVAFAIKDGDVGRSRLARWKGYGNLLGAWLTLLIDPLLNRHFVTANDVFNARSRVNVDQAAVESAFSDVSRAQNELGRVSIRFSVALSVNGGLRSLEELIDEAVSGDTSRSAL